MLNPPERSSRGSAVVEFALVLPLVFAVTLGLVQVGVLARDRALVEAAARAGARAAAVEPDEKTIHDAALGAAPGLDGSSMTVSVARAGTQGDPVTVSVTYDDPMRVPFIGWLVGTSVQLRASAVMRQEFG
jgi:Flp pilus assembly protein TadG